LKKIRTAIYAANPVWNVVERNQDGKWEEKEKPDLEEQVKKCRAFLDNCPELTLTRIYRDYDPPEGDGGKAWKMLMEAVVCREIDVIAVSTVCCIDKAFNRVAHTIDNFLLPVGVRFIDLENGFDSKTDDVKEYMRQEKKLFLLWTRLSKKPKTQGKEKL